MREIVTMEQANSLFFILAIAIPIVGVVIGAGIGARRGDAGRGAVRGFLVGLLGPANLLLWNIYNLITDRLGLDTVKNLVVNLTLFVALGMIAGLITGRLYRKRAEEPSETDTGRAKSAAAAELHDSPTA